MFTVSDRRTRREFLRIGALGLGGLTLSQLTAAQAANPSALIRDKSVIFLFLHGGPSQTETFDPKMSAPAGIRSATGEVATSLPGVTFSGSFPQLAQHADRISVVRSFRTGDGNHDIKPIVCRDSASANVGSLYARVAGTNAAHNGMPTNVALYPSSVDEDCRPTTMNFGRFESTGTLGAAYAPFVPGGGGEMQESLKLSISRDRLDDRRALLRGLDRAKRSRDEQFGGLSRFQEQALDTIVGGVGEAFDLSHEDPRLVARYDTAPLVTPSQISRRWNNYNNYVDNAKSLGKLLLLARRLCERGCGFVTVTTNFVWDMHADQNNAGVEEGMQYMGLPLDHALSAYLEDVHQRGLNDKILLVVCGEMGRNPKINNRGGRDHWGAIAPLLLAGGGLQMGQVVGQSDRHAGEPATTPIEIKHLLATIMHSLIDVGELRTVTGIPSDVQRVITSASPIQELMG